MQLDWILTHPGDTPGSSREIPGGTANTSSYQVFVPLPSVKLQSCVASPSLTYLTGIHPTVAKFEPRWLEAKGVGGTHPGALCAVTASSRGLLETGSFQWPLGSADPDPFGLLNSTEQREKRPRSPPDRTDKATCSACPAGFARETTRHQQHEITTAVWPIHILRTPLLAPPRPHPSSHGEMWPKSAVAIAACARTKHAKRKLRTNRNNMF